MITLKIYNVFSSVLLLFLAIWITQRLKDLLETEVLLEQCSDRYYQELVKINHPTSCHGMTFFELHWYQEMNNMIRSLQKGEFFVPRNL